MESEIFLQEMKLKRGDLSRELGIPIKRNIPLSILNAIILSKIGDTVINPSPLGKRRIKITRKLEQKAIWIKKMDQMKKKGFDIKLDKALAKNAMRNRMVREQLRRKAKEKIKKLKKR